MSNVIFLINLPVCTLIAMGGGASSFMSNVIFLINLPVCTLIAMGGGGIILHVKCHLPYKSACVYFESHRGGIILHVKCHLPYKSACVNFDSHGGGGGGASSFMSNVIFLINLPMCTLIAMEGGGCI